MNCYFGIMSEVITHWGGTIGGFLGDGIMVYFGAPITMADHARKALLCARAMQAAMAQVNHAMKERGYPDLEMGIGINTGEVVVGNIGSEQRAQYGAVGGPVNMAFRIESYSIGGDVLASDATLHAAGPGITILKSTTAFPKGSPGPITIHSVGGMAEAPGLTVTPADIPLFALKEPAPIKIWQVYGKDVALDPSAGLIVRLGKNVAALQFVDEAPLPAVLSNLRLELAGCGEAYAKVTALEADQGYFVVRLTQQSPGVERWMEEAINNRQQ